jgi:hypothetical protein
MGITRGSAFTIVIASSVDMIGDIGVVGGKTGTIGGTNNLGIFWEAPNGQTIGIVVLDCASDADRYADARAIIDQLPTDFAALATPATAFTPAYLFNVLGMGGAWWDGSDTAHMWQDSAGSIAVTTDLDPVGRWEPKAAGTASQSLTQATAANRPLWRSSDNRLTFDGSNDYLTLGAQSIGNTGLFCDAGEEFMTGIKFSSTGASGTGIAKAGAGSGRTFQNYHDDGTAVTSGQYFRGTASNLSGDVNDGAAHSWATCWDAASGFHSTDELGMRQIAIGTSAEEAQNIIIGARTGGAGGRLTGAVYHVVVTDQADKDAFRRLRDWLNGGTPNAFADPSGGKSFPLFMNHSMAHMLVR